MPYPLQVILAILGLPESDYPRMLQLTQELFGSSDEELSRGQSMEDLIAVINDFFVYFTQLTEDRRADPTDDLASVIANATHRRRADRRDGDDLVLRDHRHRRPRHHGVVDGRRAARADRAPRAAAAAARRPVADPDRGRRDHPLGHAGQALHAQLHDAVRAARPPLRARRHGAAVVPVGQPRRGRVRPTRSASTSGAQPNKHLAFGFGVHYCLGRDAGPHGAEGAVDRAASPGCARSSWPARRATCRRCSSAGRRACRSATR